MNASRFAIIAMALMFFVQIPTASAGNIVEEWAAVEPPAPVELKAMTVNATDTALLVLDI